MVYQHVLTLGVNVDVPSCFAAFCAVLEVVPAAALHPRRTGGGKARKRKQQMRKKMRTVERTAAGPVCHPS